MVTDSFVVLLFNFTLEASTVLVSERAPGLTTWTTKLAIANNQVIGPFGGNSSLKSAGMARSFSRICVEDEISSVWELFDVDWSIGHQPTPIAVLFMWDWSNSRGSGFVN